MLLLLSALLSKLPASCPSPFLPALPRLFPQDFKVLTNCNSMNCNLMARSTLPDWRILYKSWKMRSTQFFCCRQFYLLLLSNSTSQNVYLVAQQLNMSSCIFFCFFCFFLFVPSVLIFNPVYLSIFKRQEVYFRMSVKLLRMCVLQKL